MRRQERKGRRYHPAQEFVVENNNSVEQPLPFQSVVAASPPFVFGEKRKPERRDRASSFPLRHAYVPRRIPPVGHVVPLKFWTFTMIEQRLAIAATEGVML